MTKAFISGDRADRMDRYDNTADPFQYYPEWCAVESVREAKRILAETERPTRNGGHIDLCDLFDAIVYRPDATAFDYSPSNIDSEARMDHIVAEAIEGAMGALDELAAQALPAIDPDCARRFDRDHLCALHHPFAMPERVMASRNRATLAAMEGR